MLSRRSPEFEEREVLPVCFSIDISPPSPSDAGIWSGDSMPQRFKNLTMVSSRTLAHALLTQREASRTLIFFESSLALSQPSKFVNIQRFRGQWFQ